MPFRSTPVLRVLDEPDLWRLELPLVYRAWDEETIVVPPGFVTDLASIPRIFQVALPVNRRHRAPAIVHDYLYVIQDRTRAQADMLFLEAMTDAGVPGPKRRAMHWAVRLGGAMAWARNRARAEQDRRAFFAGHGINPR